MIDPVIQIAVGVTVGISLIVVAGVIAAFKRLTKCQEETRAAMVQGLNKIDIMLENVNGQMTLSRQWQGMHAEQDRIQFAALAAQLTSVVDYYKKKN